MTDDLIRLRYCRNLVGIITALGVIIGFLIMLYLSRERLGPDYSIRLPSGYQLERTHGNCVLLTGPGEYGAGSIIVNPAIDGYAVIEKLVVGHVSFAEHEPGSTPGYFIVDTEGHNLTDGLNKEDWARQLSEMGIDHVPSLARPSRWRSILW